MIVDISNELMSDRAGTYGGRAGFKDGIIYNNEYWIVKYPKSTVGMDVEDISYSTAPLSEYIGSHVYSILGFPVHETFLGYRNNKIVVACKDFCKNEGSLREIRTIKNLANPYLADLLERDFSSTSFGSGTNLEEILLHIKYNDILSNVPGIEERFWQCVVVDSIINNNDRNNGNWGVLYVDGKYTLAPIYDNGASFSNKTSDKKIERLLKDEESLKGSSLNTITSYKINEKTITTRKLYSLPYAELYNALEEVLPKVYSKFSEIEEMINAIPNSYKGLYVCSEVRKKYYIESMRQRIDYILAPALDNKYISHSKPEKNNELIR